jgi:SAM-dependent methyltransferase
MPRIAAGAVASPNIWNHPAVYELENRAVDPDGEIEAALLAARPWTDATVLDVGCGTGYHLPRFAQLAARVVGVEPHRDLVVGARRRCRDLPNVSVEHGAAQSLPVPDASIDIAHARWAYFFGPGCEPGLRELSRVMRSGGTAFVIDNDAGRSTFGRWFRRALPTYDADAVDAFFARHGWAATRLVVRWSFATRADLESVVRIEFVPDQADLILAEHDGLEVDYAVVIRRRDF